MEMIKPESTSSLGSDGNTSFLRAARAGHLDKVLEHLKSNIDINTCNANGLNALHLASKDGHVEVVEELLRRSAAVDAATKKGNTALHIASLAGQEEVVKLLVQHGASVNVQSQNGFTPLYMAAQENHDNVVKYLLANGANQSLATEDGFTPLAVAMQQGHDKVVTVLLENDTRGKVRLPALHIAAKKDDVKAAKLLLENEHNPDVTSKSGFTPLHIASHYGNELIANLLVQKGADVNYAAKHNISPLHVAAKWGKTNMVALLLDKGANIESKTRDGLTPLHCAARSGHEQVVDMLLERGAPISSKTKNGLAPLHMSAQGDHVDAARILLYHRAPVDEVTVDYLTALHVAAHCGHARVAKLLLDRQADANARALNGFTPLHIACKKNRIKVVELLLKHGASIGATTESGLTPLHVASFMGCMNIVIYLLQHDANPDVPTVRGETPLHLAARANQTDIIRILLRNGAHVDARAREQQTPLHIASRLGNVDIVVLLLQHGAKVDTTTKDMYTALHIAAKEGQDEVAGVLIDHGASLSATTKKGFTPLHLAAKYGNIKVAKLLLQKEAPVDAQGKNGVTPLHVASHYDHQNVALLLLERGASPHATAKNGHTPLHIAAKKNQMDIANTLLEYGAQPNAESKAGFTPLHLSSQEGHADMSALLIEHDADVNHQAKNGLMPLHLCAQEDRVPVAEILVKNGAEVDAGTKGGYTPLHVASHFGQTNMVKFLLSNGANVRTTTSIGYTPLHQAAQQGHTNIVNILLENSAQPNAVTMNGQTPLHIAQKLGYISVIETLKTVTEHTTSPTNMNAEDKYKVVAPEAMQETFMSDSEEEGGEETMLGDQTYRYLTADEMKSLGDDSLPIDVTKDERIDSNKMVTSSDSNILPPQAIEDSLSPLHITQNYIEYKKYIPDNVDIGRHPISIGFLVSFLVDARGGAMRGCRHSGVRVIVPPRCASSPTRITCRYVRPQRTPHPPPLMEGEALASRVLELGPVSAKFLGPVIIEVPHFAALRGKEREIVILRSDNGETWREHTVEASEEILNDVLHDSFEAEDLNQLEDVSSGRITRIVTHDFPQYFAVVSRVRQEVHAIGPEGGMVSSTVVPQVQAVFPQGALTKKIKVGLQAQPIDPELTAKLLGHGVAVSPVVTVEPRRRKFHKAITLSMPAPRAHSQGMINQYSGSAPTLRLLCSITGGTTRAQWEDVTGSTPLTFVNDCVSFTTTVSARFWLMDCRNIGDATKMATELYREAIHVPFMAKFVVFAKRIDPLEARLRVFCMTDDKEDKTLEHQEHFTEVAKSRDVEVLEGKPQYIEFAGNLVPITKSGDQLQFSFRAFRENRLPFSVRVKDQHAEAVGRSLFMREPKVQKGEPPQQPICILNIVLPDDIVAETISLSDESLKRSFLHDDFDYYRPDPRLADMSNLLGEDWVPLATQLGLTTSEINVIISEYPDSVAKQAQSMLRMWRAQAGNKAQGNTLENALRRIGREDIIPQCLNVEDTPRIHKENLNKYRLRKDISLDTTLYDRDIMKDSESVESLVQAERKEDKYKKRESYESKYSAEEKVVEETSDEEEDFNKTVTERRNEIEKRLSVERSIPASLQRVEIVQEIDTIKRQSLVEDKIAEVEDKHRKPETKVISETVEVKTTKTSEPREVISVQVKPEIKTTTTEVRTVEITHKNISADRRDSDLLEGVTRGLETSKGVMPRISTSVEDPNSPKLSRTPPPSPADFIIKEQAALVQEWDATGKKKVPVSHVKGTPTIKAAADKGLTTTTSKSLVRDEELPLDKPAIKSDAVKQPLDSNNLPPVLDQTKDFTQSDTKPESDTTNQTRNGREKIREKGKDKSLSRDSSREDSSRGDEKKSRKGFFGALKTFVTKSEPSDSDSEKSPKREKNDKKKKKKDKREKAVGLPPEVPIKPTKKPRLPTPPPIEEPKEFEHIPYIETSPTDLPSGDKLADISTEYVFSRNIPVTDLDEVSDEVKTQATEIVKDIVKDSETSAIELLDQQKSSAPKGKTRKVTIVEEVTKIFTPTVIESDDIKVVIDLNKKGTDSVATETLININDIEINDDKQKQSIIDEPPLRPARTNEHHYEDILEPTINGQTAESEKKKIKEITTQLIQNEINFHGWAGDEHHVQKKPIPREPSIPKTADDKAKRHGALFSFLNKKSSKDVESDDDIKEEIIEKHDQELSKEVKEDQKDDKRDKKEKKDKKKKKIAESDEESDDNRKSFFGLFGKKPKRDVGIKEQESIEKVEIKLSEATLKDIKDTDAFLTEEISRYEDSKLKQKPVSFVFQQEILPEPFPHKSHSDKDPETIAPSETVMHEDTKLIVKEVTTSEGKPKSPKSVSKSDISESEGPKKGIFGLFGKKSKKEESTENEICKEATIQTPPKLSNEIIQQMNDTESFLQEEVSRFDDVKPLVEKTTIEIFEKFETEPNLIQTQEFVKQEITKQVVILEEVKIDEKDESTGVTPKPKLAEDVAPQTKDVSKLVTEEIIHLSDQKELVKQTPAQKQDKIDESSKKGGLFGFLGKKNKKGDSVEKEFSKDVEHEQIIKKDVEKDKPVELQQLSQDVLQEMDDTNKFLQEEVTRFEDVQIITTETPKEKIKEIKLKSVEETKQPIQELRAEETASPKKGGLFGLFGKKGKRESSTDKETVTKDPKRDIDIAQPQPDKIELSQECLQEMSFCRHFLEEEVNRFEDVREIIKAPPMEEQDQKSVRRIETETKINIKESEDEIEAKSKPIKEMKETMKQIKVEVKEDAEEIKGKLTEIKDEETGSQKKTGLFGLFGKKSKKEEASENEIKTEPETKPQLEEIRKSETSQAEPINLVFSEKVLHDMNETNNFLVEEITNFDDVRVIVAPKSISEMTESTKEDIKSKVPEKLSEEIKQEKGDEGGSLKKSGLFGLFGKKGKKESSVEKEAFKETKTGKEGAVSKPALPQIDDTTIFEDVKKLIASTEQEKLTETIEKEESKEILLVGHRSETDIKRSVIELQEIISKPKEDLKTTKEPLLRDINEPQATLSEEVMQQMNVASNFLNEEIQRFEDVRPVVKPEASFEPPEKIKDETSGESGSPKKGGLFGFFGKKSKKQDSTEKETVQEVVKKQIIPEQVPLPQIDVTEQVGLEDVKPIIKQETSEKVKEAKTVKFEETERKGILKIFVKKDKRDSSVENETVKSKEDSVEREIVKVIDDVSSITESKPELSPEVIQHMADSKNFLSEEVTQFEDVRPVMPSIMSETDTEKKVDDIQTQKRVDDTQTQKKGIFGLFGKKSKKEGSVERETVKRKEDSVEREIVKVIDDVSTTTESKQELSAEVIQQMADSKNFLQEEVKLFDDVRPVIPAIAKEIETHKKVDDVKTQKKVDDIQTEKKGIFGLFGKKSKKEASVERETVKTKEDSVEREMVKVIDNVNTTTESKPELSAEVIQHMADSKNFLEDEVTQFEDVRPVISSIIKETDTEKKVDDTQTEKKGLFGLFGKKSKREGSVEKETVKAKEDSVEREIVKIIEDVITTTESKQELSAEVIQHMADSKNFLEEEITQFEDVRPVIPSIINGIDTEKKVDDIQTQKKVDDTQAQKKGIFGLFGKKSKKEGSVEKETVKTKKDSVEREIVKVIEDAITTTESKQELCAEVIQHMTDSKNFLEDEVTQFEDVRPAIPKEVDTEKKVDEAQTQKKGIFGLFGKKSKREGSVEREADKEQRAVILSEEVLKHMDDSKNFLSDEIQRFEDVRPQIEEKTEIIPKEKKEPKSVKFEDTEKKGGGLFGIFGKKTKKEDSVEKEIQVKTTDLAETEIKPQKVDGATIISKEVLQQMDDSKNFITEEVVRFEDIMPQQSVIIKDKILDEVHICEPGAGIKDVQPLSSEILQQMDDTSAFLNEEITRYDDGKLLFSKPLLKESSLLEEIVKELSDSAATTLISSDITAQQILEEKPLTSEVIVTKQIIDQEVTQLEDTTLISIAPDELSKSAIVEEAQQDSTKSTGFFGILTKRDKKELPSPKLEKKKKKHRKSDSYDDESKPGFFEKITRKISGTSQEAKDHFENQSEAAKVTVEKAFEDVSANVAATKKDVIEAKEKIIDDVAKTDESAQIVLDKTEEVIKDTTQIMDSVVQHTGTKIKQETEAVPEVVEKMSADIKDTAEKPILEITKDVKDTTEHAVKKAEKIGKEEAQKAGGFFSKLSDKISGKSKDAKKQLSQKSEELSELTAQAIESSKETVQDIKTDVQSEIKEKSAEMEGLLEGTEKEVTDEANIIEKALAEATETSSEMLSKETAKVIEQIDDKSQDINSIVNENTEIIKPGATKASKILVTPIIGTADATVGEIEQMEDATKVVKTSAKDITEDLTEAMLEQVDPSKVTSIVETQPFETSKKGKKDKKSKKKSGGFFSALGEKITGFTKDVKESTDDSKQKILEKSNEISEETKVATVGIVSDIKDNVADETSQVKQTIEEVPRDIFQFVSHKTKDTVEDTSTKITDTHDELLEKSEDIKADLQRIELDTKEFLSERAAKIEKEAKELKDAIAEKRSAITEQIPESLTDITKKSLEKAQKVKDEARDLSTKSADHAINLGVDIGKKINEETQIAKERIEKEFVDTTETVKEDMDKFTKFTAEIESKGYEEATDIGEKLRKGFETASEITTSGTTELETSSEKVGEEISKRVETIMEKATTSQNTVKKIKAASSASAEAVVTKAQDLTTFVDGVYIDTSKLSSAASDDIGTIKESVTTTLSDSQTTAKDEVREMTGLLDEVKHRISDEAGKVEVIAADKTENALQILAEKEQQLTEALHQTKQGVTDTLKDKVDNCKKFATTAEKSVTDKVIDAKGQIDEKGAKISHIAVKTTGDLEAAAVAGKDKIAKDLSKVKEQIASGVEVTKKTLQDQEDSAKKVKDKAKEGGEKTGGFFSGLKKKISREVKDSEEKMKKKKSKAAKHIEQVTAKGEETVDIIRKQTSDDLEVIKDTIQQKSTDIKDKSGQYITQADDFLASGISTGVEFTTDLDKNINDGVKDVTEKVDSSADTISITVVDMKDTTVAAKDAVVDVGETAFTKTKENGKEFIEKGETYLESLEKRIDEKTSAVKGRTEEAVKSVTKQIVESKDVLTTTLSDTFDDSKQRIDQKSEETKSTITHLKQQIQKSTVTAKEDIYEKAETSKDALNERIDFVTSGIAEKVADTAETFEGAKEQFKAGVVESKEYVSKTVEASKDTAKKQVDSVVSGIDQKTSVARETLWDTREKVQESIAVAKEDVSKKTETCKDELKEQVDFVTSGITQKIGDTKEILQNIKEDIKLSAIHTKEDISIKAEASKDALKEQVDSGISGIDKKTDETKQAFGNIKEQIKKDALEAKEDISITAETSKEVVKENIDSVISEIDHKKVVAKQTVGDIKDQIKIDFLKAAEVSKDVVKEQVDSVVSEIGQKKDGAKQVVGDIREQIKVGVTGAKEEISTEIKSSKDALTEYSDSIVSALGPKTTEAKEVLKDAKKTVKIGALDVKEDISNKVEASKESLKEQGDSIISGISQSTAITKELLKDAKETVQIGASEVKEDISKKVKASNESLKDQGDSIILGISQKTAETKEILKDTKETVKIGVLDVKEDISKTVEASKESLKEQGDSIMSGISQKAADIKKSFEDTKKKIKIDGAAVKEDISKKVDISKDKVKEMIQEKKSVVEKGLDNTGAFLLDLGMNIGSEVKDVKDKIGHKAESEIDIIDKKVTGISDTIKDIKDQKLQDIKDIKVKRTEKIEEGKGNSQEIRGVKDILDTTGNLFVDLGMKLGAKEIDELSGTEVKDVNKSDIIPKQLKDTKSTKGSIDSTLFGEAKEIHDILSEEVRGTKQAQDRQVAEIDQQLSQLQSEFQAICKSMPRAASENIGMSDTDDKGRISISEQDIDLSQIPLLEYDIPPADTIYDNTSTVPKRSTSQKLSTFSDVGYMPQETASEVYIVSEPDEPTLSESQQPKRKAIFHLESEEDETFDINMPGKYDIKPSLLETLSEPVTESLIQETQNLQDLIAETSDGGNIVDTAKTVIKDSGQKLKEIKAGVYADVEILEQKLDDLDKALGYLEKADLELSEKEKQSTEDKDDDKTEKKLRRVERKFERLASQTMDDEVVKAKEKELSTPDVEEKRETDYQRIVSQLSTEEVSDLQRDYSSLWDDHTFSPSDEWDSKTPDSQAEVHELPQGEASGEWQHTPISGPEGASLRAETDEAPVEEPESTIPGNIQQRQIADQHRLSEEMKLLLKEMEEQHKK